MKIIYSDASYDDFRTDCLFVIGNLPLIMSRHPIDHDCLRCYFPILGEFLSHDLAKIGNLGRGALATVSIWICSICHQSILIKFFLRIVSLLSEVSSCL